VAREAEAVPVAARVPVAAAEREQADVATAAEQADADHAAAVGRS
jgi:hypothetical protein